ncbi:hypothetical protein EDB19DRAFT_2027943 [Suillus lakei]|nr:hypothetical protein EDB19DRAFT_2027943 [Suillus lakei]
MSSIEMYNIVDIIEETNFKSLSSSSPPKLDPSAVIIAASLTVGRAHNLVCPDAWSFDSFITPGNRENLGTGDRIIVYRQMFNPFINPLPLPAFSGTLDNIVAWGSGQIVFGVRGLNTENFHPKTIRLPLVIVRLSTWQHIRRIFFPFPRIVIPLAPSIEQLHKRAKRLRELGRIGDRVPRDSDGLPIWE